MEVQQALAMGRRLMREHGLDGWTLVADRAKTRAGVCRFARRQIGISGPLTALHSEEDVRDTVLHEIAHALVGPEHGHDAVWRATAVRIGCTGERCVPADAPRVPGDWVGRCPAGHERTRHRAPTRLMSCGRCSRRFDTAHLFTWSFRGGPATLPPSYAAELAEVRRAAVPVTAVEPPGLGDLVEVAMGPWAGMTGEVELVGSVRCQVRVDDELVSLPIEAVRPAPSAAVGTSADGAAVSSGAGDAA
ncbi:SprT-like domain-containing protein [Phycicoccus sonneratiae]|uniref:SprT-like domain-containing protein n=1 Tax=Phycicoccus sonneratiae TaxID=2807628 RepID=A0ABS2CK44_9MICO|nr:SprT-like domain-containing protein [Phycicoccus sonneraticus]MBM6400249.1 SprT-like domain-containing protein [Phycicoccus sonneraticus]